MNNEFKQISKGDITRYVLESGSSGDTSSGSVASVSMPIGGTRKRGANLIAQEADKKTVPATTPRNFVAKNAKSSGAGAHKDKKKAAKQGQEKHKKPFMEDHSTASGGWGKGSYDTYTAGNHGRGVAEDERDHPDHEIQMASSELLSIAKNAESLLDMVRRYSEQEGLDAWQQSKITKAADYLNSVLQSVNGEQQGVAEGETSTPAIYVKAGGKYPGMTIAPKGWSRIRDIKDEGNSYFVMVGNDGDGLNIPKDKVSPHEIKLKNGMPITAKQAFMMFNGWTPDRGQGVAEAFPNPGSGNTGSSKADKRIAAALRKKHIPTTPNDKKKQGVAEGSNNDYQQGVDDGVEYFLYTDGEGDTIKDVFLQMKRSATEPKSEKYWRGVVDGMKSVQSEEQVEQGVAEGSETSQQQQVRAAITKGMEKWDSNNKSTYQSQPTKTNYMPPSGYASDSLTGVDSIDPDGTVVISLGNTGSEATIKKLATLGGMPGIKTRQLQSPTVSSRGVEEGEGKRCMQCGMTDCTCAPGKCKCKPVAGWIPNKGFKKDVDESWDDIKKFGKKAAVAGAIGLGIGAAHAGGWSPSDVPAGGHNQLPDIVAHVKFKVGDKEVSKEINLGSHYRSPGEAGKELENFLKSKGIKFYEYSLERVKPKDDDKMDSSPATGDMKGSMDTKEPATTGPSTDNYMAKDNDPEHGPSMGGKFVKEGAKVDRQAKHITASMMKKGKSKKDAESIAWAHIKHPKNESADPYFESLQSMVERQLEPTMNLDSWIDNFQNADPNKYHQFKNKTPEKKK